MPSIRQILAVLGAAILSGVIAGSLSNVLSLNANATIVVVQFGMTILTLWLGGKLGWWDKVNTSGISEDSLPKILLHMLIGGAIIAVAGVLAVLFGHEMPGVLVAAGVGFIGLLWAGMAATRSFVWLIAARKDPALADERMRLNLRKSERWALLACFEMALILGLFDYEGWLVLSGATVGFAVAIAGMVVGLASQLWLEVKDG